jgi:hypothetical protein
MGITFRLLGQRGQKGKVAEFFAVICYAGFDLLVLADEGTLSAKSLMPIQVGFRTARCADL